MRMSLRGVHVMVVALSCLAGATLAEAFELEPWSGTMPDNAVAAGKDGAGKPVRVCVVSSWGGQHPGALTGDGVCRVAWGGQEYRFGADFQVLIGDAPDSGEWVSAAGKGVPDGAFRAGGDDAGPLYVCRAEAKGGKLPGRLTDTGWCYVAVDGDERILTEGYEVLVE